MLQLVADFHAERGRLSREISVKRNDAASQEVTHSVVAVYAMIIAERGEKRNRQI